MTVDINSLQDMEMLGKELSADVGPGQCWYFDGQLGAGKTTLIQSIFSALGVEGPVLSPTFSIFEPHLAESGTELLHIDLYRIDSPEELIHTGLDVYERSDCSWFVEWPSRGGSMIPDPDVRVVIEYDCDKRRVTVERSKKAAEE